MAEVLLEIGTEEIPARFMPKMLAEIKSGLEKVLAERRLSFKQINTWGTDRRVAVIINGLPDKQSDLKKEIKGPPENAAYKDGKLTQAGEGFCRKNNIDPGRIELKDFNGTKYLFVNLFEKGQPTKNILPEVYKQVLTSLHLPIAMRWGNQDLQFIRPIHWLVSLYADAVLKFEFAGIKAGNKSSGHRFISPGEVTIKSIKSYLKDLEKRSVFADPEIRRDMILAQIKQIEKDKNLTAVISDEVLNEVTYINECPFAVVAEIDEKYLAVPQECLIVTMQKNQKYFPLVDKNGKLTKYFILISNNVNKNSLANIIAGNLKVVTARLEDAKFFYEEDKKVKMKDWVEYLKNVTYQEKIGSIYEKIQRIIKNTEWLVDKLQFTSEEKEEAKRAAYLCKADLASKMVYEFPELQGIMGKYYAYAEERNPIVAEAMLDHWKPRYAGEDISKISKISAVVAIADKIDSITSCFSVGLIPTSSSDPYALRRAANGIIRLLYEKQIFINLSELIDQVLGDNVEKNKIIAEFFKGRRKSILQEMNIDYDVIDAVLAGDKSILPTIEIAKQLKENKAKIKNTVYEPFIRMYKILEGKVFNFNSAYFENASEQEKALSAGYVSVKKEVELGLESKNYKAALFALEKLADLINKFFDKVLVNDAEEKNKKGLLCVLVALYAEVAAFNLLVYDNK